MPTIIRKFNGANFSDSIVLDLEAKIDWPVSNLLGAYRLKVSAAQSASPKAGRWPALTQGSNGTITYTPRSVIAAGAQAIAGGSAFPASELTCCVVFKQDQNSHKALCGVANGSAIERLFGLYTSKETGLIRCRFGNAPESPLGIPFDGGERWEMIFASFKRGVAGTPDSPIGQARLYRPRTGTAVEGQFTEVAKPESSFRVFGFSGMPSTFSGETEIALSAHWDAVLSQQAMDALYASAKASLAASDVII